VGDGADGVHRFGDPIDEGTVDSHEYAFLSFPLQWERVAQTYELAR
jgi:hypothetical protein